jgi:hypothetical protein
MNSPERTKTVDQIGALEAKLAPYAGDIATLKRLREAAREWPAADKIAPESTACYSGKRYVLTLGMRENERKIRNLADVFALVGKVRFVAACSLTLKALGELVGQDADKFVSFARTGYRTITVAKL